MQITIVVNKILTFDLTKKIPASPSISKLKLALAQRYKIATPRRISIALMLPWGCLKRSFFYIIRLTLAFLLCVQRHQNKE